MTQIPSILLSPFALTPEDTAEDVQSSMLGLSAEIHSTLQGVLSAVDLVVVKSQLAEMSVMLDQYQALSGSNASPH